MREEQGLCTEPGAAPAAPRLVHGHHGHGAAGRATEGKETLPSVSSGAASLVLQEK